MKLMRILSTMLAGALLVTGAATGAAAIPEPAPQTATVTVPEPSPSGPCGLVQGGGAECGNENGGGGRDPEAQFDRDNWGGTCSLLDRTVVPCIDEAGWAWNFAYQCYRRDVSDQYPPEDPIWLIPGEGLIIDCRRIDETEHETFWVWDLDGTVNPAVLAQQLIANLKIPPPGVTMAPDPYQTANQQAAIIGFPMWMWVLDTTTVQTLSDEESAGPITVSIEAVPDRIEWTMGDGTVVVCPIDAPGYTDEFAGMESPSCGHVYQTTSAGQPDEKYEVVARAYYNVNWTSGTFSGTQEIAPFSTFHVPVVEFQSNNT